MKRIMIALMAVVLLAPVFVFAGVSDAAVEQTSSDVRGLSLGVEVVSYGSDYTIPYEVDVPKKGTGFVFGDLNPGGWKVSVTQTRTQSQDGGVKTAVEDDNILLTTLPGQGPFNIDAIEKTMLSEYKITTIEYFKYINVMKEEKKLFVPITLFVDLGVGGEIVHVDGTIGETYDYGYWTPYVINPHYHNSEKTFTEDRVFGNIGVQFGVKTKYVTLTVGSSRIIGRNVAGFRPGLTSRIDLGIRW